MSKERNIYILPEFSDNHLPSVRQLGFKIGPVARKEGHLSLRLVCVPKWWSEASDVFGHYLIDEKGRRRVQFMFQREGGHAYDTAGLLTRFAIQNWFSPRGRYYYVRFTVGGEQNIFQFPRCQHVFKFDTENGSVDSGAMALCREWLSKNYPEWKDPLAYWDLEVPVKRDMVTVGNL